MPGLYKKMMEKKMTGLYKKMTLIESLINLIRKSNCHGEKTVKNIWQVSLLNL